MKKLLFALISLGILFSGRQAFALDKITYSHPLGDNCTAGFVTSDFFGLATVTENKGGEIHYVRNQFYLSGAVADVPDGSSAVQESVIAKCFGVPVSTVKGFSSSGFQAGSLADQSYVGFSFDIYGSHYEYAISGKSGTRRITTSPKLVRPLVAAKNPSIPTTTVGIAVSAFQPVIVTEGTGTPPYLYKLKLGTLPAGLSLSTDGNISGTPTVVGKGSSYTVTVTDDAAVSVDVPFELNVAKGDQTISFTPPTTVTYSPTITVAHSPTATVAHSPTTTVKLSATGGKSGLPVTFTSDTTTVCTVGGKNMNELTTVTGGQCTITASQAGNDMYAAAKDVVQTFQIGKVLTETALTASNAAPKQGETVTYTATVSSTVTPDGKVSFASGQTALCSNVAVSNAGVATCEYRFSDAGSYSVVANYTGGPNTQNSQSAALVAQIDDLVSQTSKKIETYMTNRAKAIVADSPDMIERLRGGPQGAQGNPLGFAATGNDENLHMSFNTSLRGMVAQREQARRKAAQAEMADARIGKAFSLDGTYALGYGTETAKVNTATAPSSSASSQSYVGFDAWASGTYARVNSGTSSSDIGLIHSGVDYRFSDQLLLGVLAQFDYDKHKDGALSASGWGYMVGPYIAAKLADNLYFDSTATFGQSFNDINTGSSTGKFNTNRFMLTAKLSGDVDLGNQFTLTPFVKGVYFWEKQKSYTDSLSNVIPKQTINLASIEFGPKLSKSFKQDNGTMIKTSASLSGIYASETGSQSIRAKIGSSLGMSFVNGVSVDFLAFYDGLGDNDYEAYGASAKMRVPF